MSENNYDNDTPTVNGADCCAVPSAGNREPNRESLIHCPSCGTKGKRIDTQTVKALLAVSLRSLQAERYRFCRTEDCPVVYFSSDGSEWYQENHLRERAHQKHPAAADVFVCYCFRHTPGSIRAELLETGESTAVAEINAGIQAGQCACEIRNPQGSCCLGNVTATVKRVQAALTSMSA